MSRYKNKVRFIGDIHGKVHEYLEIINKNDCQYSLQIGDFGIGYPNIYCHDLGYKHKFFHGNHDCPLKCLEHPNGLDRFGIWNNIFYIAGAWTPPFLYDIRPYNNWWPDEELSNIEMIKCRKLWSNIKPEVVATHDCPSFIKNDHISQLTGIEMFDTCTDLFLQELFKIHKPKTWIFGHYHMSINIDVEGCNFICLDELEWMDIDINV